MNKWDERFMQMAALVSSWSKDPSTKVGAVIVNDQKQILSVGYNGFPRGVYDDPTRYENREVKHNFVVHAERNALDNAFTEVKGSYLYTTHFPCHECAKSIVQKGIKKIFTPKPDPSKQYIADLAKHTTAMTIFCESGVDIFYTN